MSNKIILMNKNTPVIEIYGELEHQETNLYPKILIKNINYINKKLCPPGIFFDNPDGLKAQFENWFKKRIISRKREDLQKIQEKEIRWDGNPNLLSLTDQYWLRFDDNEKWEDLNFFTNNFNSYLGDVCFSKNLNYIQKINLSWNTPDITTNGVLKKRWVQLNGKDNKHKSILIKSMSKQFGQEPLSEILASKLLEKLNFIPFVKYSLYIEGYDLCSYCENFVSPDVEFVPAGAVFYQTPANESEEIQSKPEYIYKHLIDSIDYFNIPDGKEFIDKMIIADRLMMNFDRHLGNFGYLRSVETGNYIGPAPLFDFGNAFFSEMDSYQTKTFKQRENELFKNKKIEPLNKEIVNEFVEEIKNCPLLSFNKTIKIIKNIEANNKEIEQKTLEMQKLENESVKNRKGKEIQQCVVEE